MNTKLMAQLLGLSPEASTESIESAIAANAQAKKDGEVALAAAQAEVKASKQIIERFEAAVGAKGDAAFGALDAHLANSKKLATVEAQVAADAKTAEDEKRARLTAEALDPNSGSPHAGKLTKPVADLYATKPVAELEGFLAVATRQVPAPVEQSDPTAGAKSPTGVALLKHDGKTYAELQPLEKARLKQSNPALHAQMKNQAEGNAA